MGKEMHGVEEMYPCPPCQECGGHGTHSKRPIHELEAETQIVYTLKTTTPPKCVKIVIYYKVHAF